MGKAPAERLPAQGAEPGEGGNACARKHVMPAGEGLARGSRAAASVVRPGGACSRSGPRNGACPLRTLSRGPPGEGRTKLPPGRRISNHNCNCNAKEICRQPARSPASATHFNALDIFRKAVSNFPYSHVSGNLGPSPRGGFERAVSRDPSPAASAERAPRDCHARRIDQPRSPRRRALSNSTYRR
jgi:hypothetical protein